MLKADLKNEKEEIVAHLQLYQSVDGDLIFTVGNCSIFLDKRQAELIAPVIENLNIKSYNAFYEKKTETFFELGEMVKDCMNDMRKAADLIISSGKVSESEFLFRAWQTLDKQLNPQKIV